MTVVLQFDGASKGNPGVGGSAAVLLKNGVLLHSRMYSHPHRVTNNVTEYYGLIIGLQLALENGYTEICVEGDSKLVIEQVFGTWKCSHKNMIPLCEESKKLKALFKSISGRWIPRENNSEADKYANMAIKRNQMTIMEAFEKNKT
jgi:ribonuclease HI